MVVRVSMLVQLLSFFIVYEFCDSLNLIGLVASDFDVDVPFVIS